jgi:hypothetical protein
LGVLVGFIVNTALFIGIILYIRKKQTAGLRLFGFDDNNNSNSNDQYGIDKNVRLKFKCISCDVKVKGSKCKKCGSKMKNRILRNFEKLLNVEYLNIQCVFLTKTISRENGKNIEKIHTAILSHIIIKKLMIIIIE